MWVPKTPPRYDFCGRPPCPLCFDWVDENGNRIPGTEKFQQDMLGSKRSPTVKEQQTLDEAADKIHAENVRLNEQKDLKVEQFHAEDDRQRLQRKLIAKAKDRPIAKKEPRKPTLDELDIEAIVAKEKEESERAKAIERLRQLQVPPDPYGIYRNRIRPLAPSLYSEQVAYQKAQQYLRDHPEMKAGNAIIIPVPGGGRFEFEIYYDPARMELAVKQLEYQP